MRHEIAPAGNRTVHRVTITGTSFDEQVPFEVGSYEKLPTVTRLA
jgi:hypothetical protein